jgi:predicted  nucleic acid-binding Zn-ribbon protein
MLVFPLAVILVTPAERERMDSLSLRIQEEKNSDKFATLLRELSQLVGRKARRLNDQVADLDFQRTSRLRKN